MKLYSEMTQEEKDRIDAQETAKEARKASFIGADEPWEPIEARLLAQWEAEAMEANDAVLAQWEEEVGTLTGQDVEAEAEWAEWEARKAP